MTRLPQLQILRAVAALAVLAHHTNEAYDRLHNLFAFGQYGVDLFFVLSGFVIQLIHGRDIGYFRSLPKYLMRRFSRIYPPYWIFSAVFLPLALYRTPELVDFSYLVTSIFILPADHYIIEVAWTLAHEVKFYIAFAVIIALPRPAGLLFLGAGIAASAIAWLVGHETFLLTSLNLEFAAGMAACVLFQRGISRRIALALIVAGAALFVIGLTKDASRLVIGGIPAAFIVLGVSALSLRAKILERIGDSSYSLYLIHFPLLFLVNAILRHSGLPLAPLGYGCGAVAIIVLSVLASEHVEMPASRLLRLDLGRIAGRAT